MHAGAEEARCRQTARRRGEALFEQAADVVCADAAREEVAVVHHAAEEVGLAACERSDLLLDRAACDQPVDQHGASLADTVGAVDRLGLRSRVLPRVEQEAVVRLGEVEAEPTGLEADQEDRVCALLETLQHALASARLTVQVAIADPLAIETGADLREESRELAEHERPVATAGHVAQPLDERVELGTGDVVTALVDEARMQAELA